YDSLNLIFSPPFGLQYFERVLAFGEQFADTRDFRRISGQRKGFFWRLSRDCLFLATLRRRLTSCLVDFLYLFGIEILLFQLSQELRSLIPLAAYFSELQRGFAKRILSLTATSCL